MQFSFLKKDTKKIVAIFDIGSDSVGGSLVDFSSDTKKIPKIIKSYRQDIPFQDKLDFGVFMDDMIRTLKDVSNHIATSGAGAPDKISIILSSPWYLSETRHILFEEKYPFVFKDGLLKKILSQESHKIKKVHEKLYGEDENGVIIIGKDIVQVKLNGYVVADPIDKKTKSVEMDMILTLASKKCIKSIEDVIKSTFHEIPFYFSSAMSSLYLTARDKYHNTDSFMIVDVGGEVTDVSIILDGIPKNIISFPFGRQTFFRYLKKWLNKDVKEIESLFSMYQEGTLESKEREKMDKALSPIRKMWSEDLIEAIKTIPEPKIIPSAVFILMNKDVHSWFLSIFSEKNTDLSGLFKNECEVVGLMGADFLGYCKVEDGPCDPMIMMEAMTIKRKDIF
ncbi:MAG: hypothetical protein NTX85_03475 [Candidatus Nomurabacteria bacterium]|nr:hypothetical protein [Candidatus Nomurabacteria bacterium]